MMEFATAALPWVIMGLGVAVAMVYFDKKAKKEE